MKWKVDKMNKKKILVVDDEPHIAEGVKLNLELQGHNVKLLKMVSKG